MSPSLATERVTLIPYTAAMVTDQHIAWLNDRDTVWFSEQRHKTHTLESQHEYLNKFPIDSHIWLIKIPEHHHAGRIVRIVRSVDIGTITAYIDEPNARANMGIMIGEKIYRGLGLGSEAWDLVMDFLHRDAIRKIECGCMISNIAMRRLAEESGMVHESTINEHFLLDGRPEALVTYGILTQDLYK
jgi:[ribosomal protein S5]-alanine N-acetyltransferase